MLRGQNISKHYLISFMNNNIKFIPEAKFFMVLSPDQPILYTRSVA